MNRRFLVFSVLLVVVLVAAAIVVSTSRYSGPQGAATGESGGCDGEPAEGDSLENGNAEEAVELAAGAPAQITYKQVVGGQNCLVVTIEPMDGVATIDDLCLENHQPQVIELDDGSAKAVLDGYEALKESVCGADNCPPGERIEVLTVDEEHLMLPYKSPLKESMQQVLSMYEVDEGDGEAGNAPDEPEPEVQAAPVYEITLKPEQGAVFANGDVLSEASPLKVDLICFASSISVDMQAGAGPTMSKQKHLKLFRTPGGTVQKFSSIDELPDELPKDDDRDMVHNADAGNGFVVENNVSQGYTKVFVKDADDGKAVLQYQPIQ